MNMSRQFEDRRAILTSSNSLAEKGAQLEADLALFRQPLSDVFILFNHFVDLKDDEAMNALIDVFAHLYSCQRVVISSPSRSGQQARRCGIGRD